MIGIKSALAVVSVLLLAGAPSAVAAPGSAYGPAPTGPTGVPGGYTTIVAAYTVGAHSANLSVPAAGASYKVKVPARSFGGGVQIEFTSPKLSALNHGLTKAHLKGWTAITGIGVTALNANGSALKGNFAKPLTITIRKSSITKKDRLVMFTAAHKTKNIAHTTKGHTISFTLRHDPDIAVLRRK